MRTGKTGPARIQQRRFYTPEEEARLLAIAPPDGSKVRDGDMIDLALMLERKPSPLACKLYELRGRRRR